LRHRDQYPVSVIPPPLSYRAGVERHTKRGGDKAK